MKFKLDILIQLLRFKWNRLFHWSEQGWESLRKKRLKKLYLHLRNSPAYRELVNQNAPLSEFPVIHKNIFMRDFDQINTVNIKKADALKLALEAEKTRDFSPMIDDITIGLSSGTSGNTGIFLVSPRERAHWVAGILDRVIGFSLQKRKVTFFLRANSNLYESARSRLLEFAFFDIMQPIGSHIEKLKSFQPDILIAQPSVLRSLAKAQEKGKMNLSLKKLISVAEVLESIDRKHFEKVFGITISEVYQCTEGFLAASCPAGRLHFNEDFIFLEKKYLDEGKKRFHPVITDLYRYTQPVIRYELNDIIVEYPHCECGQPGTAIDFIEGRSDDVFIFTDENGEETTVYPDLMRRAIITASGEITFYHLTQTDQKTIAVYLEHEGSQNDIQDKVKSQLLEKLAGYKIHNIEIIFTHSYQHEPGTKLRRIKNEYSKAD